MDCFDHERRDGSSGTGKGTGTDYDIPWDGYVYLTRHVVPGSVNPQTPQPVTGYAGAANRLAAVGRGVYVPPVFRAGVAGRFRRPPAP